MLNMLLLLVHVKIILVEVMLKVRCILAQLNLIDKRGKYELSDIYVCVYVLYLYLYLYTNKYMCLV